MASPVSTAVDPVSATSLAGSAASTVGDLSILSLFLQADWVVKLVILLLIIASFWCWAIIFEKAILLKTLRNKTKTFENEFWSSEALDKFHERVKKRSNHPMAIIFVAAMEEWFRSKSSGFNLQPGSLRASVKDRIFQVMQVARNRELDKLESGLGFLATTGSSAPFIGLFGTVWGIMHSFHSIAATKNTSLSAVAPGIAEALFATAVGLFAAIPAVIAYNKFSNEIASFAGKLEDFGAEFNTIISRQIEG